MWNIYVGHMRAGDGEGMRRGRVCLQGVCGFWVGFDGGEREKWNGEKAGGRYKRNGQF